MFRATFLTGLHVICSARCSFKYTFVVLISINLPQRPIFRSHGKEQSQVWLPSFEEQVNTHTDCGVISYPSEMQCNPPEAGSQELTENMRANY
jgi:hypothetical protein